MMRAAGFVASVPCHKDYLTSCMLHTVLSHSFRKVVTDTNKVLICRISNDRLRK